MIRNGAVTAYRPQVINRPVATSRRYTPPARTTSRTQDNEARGRQGVDWSQVESAFRSTPEAAQQEQKKAQAQYEKENPNSFWEDAASGLGTLVNNPFTRNIIMPLGALGTPRRLIEYGMEQFAEHAPGPVQQFVTHAGGGVGKAIVAEKYGGNIDTERTGADDRGFASKVLDPRSDYGYGQFLNENNNEWANRLGGFGMDVATDPLTYLSGGANKVVGMAPEAVKAIEESAAAYKAAEAAGASAPELERLSKIAEAASDAGFKGAAVKPAGAGAPARAQQIADFSVERPELAAELQDELTRGGQRGFNTMSKEARRAMGIQDPGLRVRGFDTTLPGTGKITEGLSAAGGAVRVGLGKIPKLDRLSRAPKGLEESRRILTRGAEASPEEFERATVLQHMADQMRLGGGSVTTRGNRMLRSLARKDFKGLSEDGVRTMMKDAELSATPNPINKFFSGLADVYEQVTGKPIVSSIDRDSYVPHVLRPEAKRILRGLGDSDPRVAEVLKRSGFLTEDLLEGSGFLEKARAFRPEAPGVSTDIPIGDRVMTLKNGDIGELNREMKKVFPEIKGKFYEDDPIRIGESYVNSIAKDAARMKAANAAAETASPLVQRVEGSLGDELDARNAAFARQNPLADYIEGGNIEAPIGTPPPKPADTDVFSSEVARNATQDRRNMVIQQGPEVKAALAESYNAQRQEVRETLSQLRRNMMSDSKDALAANRKAATVLNKRITTHNKTLTSLIADREASGEALTSFMVGIKRDIAEIEDTLRSTKSSFGGRIRREQAKFVKNIEGQLETLRGIESDARTKLLNARGTVGAEADRRAEELMAPVRSAQQRLDRARAEALTTAGAPDADRLENARRVINQGEKVDRSEQLRDEYRRVLEGEDHPLVQKTKRGRLSAQSQRDLDARAAELRTQLGGTVRESQYDVEQRRLGELDQAIEQAPDPATRQSLVTERRRLNYAFNHPQGRHFSEAAARRTVAEHTAAEKSIADAVAPFEKELNRQQYLADIQVEQGGNYAGTSAPRTERQAIEDLRGSYRDVRVKEGQRLRSAQTRIGQAEESAARGSEDVGLLRAEQGTIMDNLAHQQEVATGLKDEVLEASRNNLRRLDEEKLGVQVNLKNDMQDRSRLVKGRKELEASAKRAKNVGEPLRAKSSQLDKIHTDMAKVAAANPLFDDDALTATESLLNTARTQLDDAKSQQLTEKMVERMIRDAKDGKMAKVMLTSLNDNWRMLHDGVLGRGDLILDRQLSDQFKRLYELDKQPKLLGRAFNAYTNLFKTYATLSPGFHVRNALSAIFMNASDGVGLGHMIDGVKLWREYSNAANPEEWLVAQPSRVQAAFEAVAGSGAGGRFTEAGAFGLGDEAAGFGSRTYNKLASNRLTRLSQRAGERVEGSVRLGMALDSMASGESVSDALSRISRVHFDYGQLSKMDAQAKRVIPFWTFMSRNLPLQISQMYSKPGAYAIFDSAVRNLGSDPLPYTPQYWLKGGAFNTGQTVPDVPGLGGAQGLPVYIDPDFGYQRVNEDVTNIGSALGGDVGPLLSSLNPGVTAPIEFATKSDFFTGRQFGPNDYSKAEGPLGIPTNILAALTGQRNDQGEVSENFQNLLRSLNPLQDRSARLAPQLSGGNDEDRKRQLESVLRFSGVPIRTLTPKQQENEAYRRYFDALEAQKAKQASLRRVAAS